MKIDLNQFREAYLQESGEHLASMEGDLLALRTAPADLELLNSIFRSAHTIKGGGGLFGYASLVQFTHALETLLDLLREGELSATEQIIELLLQSIDIVGGLLKGSPDAVLSAEAAALKASLESFTAVEAENAHPTAPTATAAPETGSARNCFQIHFRPCRELFASGTNPIVLLRNLGELGEVRSCQLQCDSLPALEDLEPEICYLSWTVELETERLESEIQEVFEFVEDLAEIDITRIEEGEEKAASPTPSREMSPQATQGASRPQEKASAAPGKSFQARKSDSSSDSGFIRVSTDKVDRLIDLVGELVIAHVMTAQMVENFDPASLSKLRESVAAMERNTRELHERVMSIRMLPVGMLFQRYPRAVYDIARSTGKQIRLEMSGEETEIDRSMLDSLGDPMVHLVRNAADHGIESPEIRRAAGKPEEGVITLRAFHRAGRIMIEIADDGAGIDLARVRQKAIEREIIRPDSELSDEQLRMLIFEPGFSTTQEVTDLSGRGVGMDVVRRGIQNLNGALTLTSEKGRGTRISIELPLTLAILEGLLVSIGGRILVLPLLAVTETVPLAANQIERVAESGEVVVIRNEAVPLLRLTRFLGEFCEESCQGLAADACSERKLAVIVQAGERKIGLVVDELLGQQQVVVKSLEKHLRKVDGLMGATILGDGSVAPIVDVGGLAALNLFGPLR